MIDPVSPPTLSARTRRPMAAWTAGILLALGLTMALFSLTFLLPPERICRHFNKDPRDTKVTLVGYSFSIKYGLKYEYSAQCDGHTYSVRYSIVPWGDIEVPPP